MLCEAGADVNLICNERTPLHAAAGRSDADLEIIRLLLDHGGDVNKFVEVRGTPVRFSPLKASQKDFQSLGHQEHPNKYKVISNIAEAVHCY